MDNIFSEVRVERKNQDKKWGQQNHDPFTWLSILGEEYGESQKAVLENRYGDMDISEYREELVQVAAVTIAMIECFDRYKKGGIYLAGPIKGCSLKEMNEWREYCSCKIKHPIINPALRDFRGDIESNYDCMNEIVNPDKNEINSCSVLLANCWQTSVGTSMEILYAWERGKLIVSVIPEGKEISAWIVAHSHKLYHSMDEAIEYINELTSRDFKRS